MIHGAKQKVECAVKVEENDREIFRYYRALWPGRWQVPGQ